VKIGAVAGWFILQQWCLKGGAMRKCGFLLVCFVLLLGQFGAVAQSSDTSKKVSADAVPPAVLAGLDAYKNKGPEEAILAWVKGSPMDGNKDALSQANILRQVQDYYGAYQGFEVSSTQDLSPRSRVIYLVLDYEKGPLFAKFLVYRAGQSWMLTSFTFNTKPELIFPATQ
jgi:hypothetical protein